MPMRLALSARAAAAKPRTLAQRARGHAHTTGHRPTGRRTRAPTRSRRRNATGHRGAFSSSQCRAASRRENERGGDASWRRRDETRRDATRRCGGEGAQGGGAGGFASLVRRSAWHPAGHPLLPPAPPTRGRRRRRRSRRARASPAEGRELMPTYGLMAVCPEDIQRHLGETCARQPGGRPAISTARGYLVDARVMWCGARDAVCEWHGARHPAATPRRRACRPPSPNNKA